MYFWGDQRFVRDLIILVIVQDVGIDCGIILIYFCLYVSVYIFVIFIFRYNEEGDNDNVNISTTFNINNESLSISH